MSKKINKIGINILAIFFLLAGLSSVFLSKVWAPIDEPSHFSYINSLALKHKIPILNKDIVPWQVAAISDGSYYKNSPDRTEEYGVAHGTIYEGFQPPFSYLISVPVFYLAGGNYIHKVYALRLFGFIQYLIALILAFQVFKKLKLSKLLFFSMALIPGVILRSITVSNAPTEILLVTLIFYFLAKNFERNFSPKQMFLLGIFAGLATLTKFTSIYLIPSLLVYFWSIGRKFRWDLVFIVLMPLFILSPWLLWNYQTFGSLTANSISQQLQAPIIYANGHFNKLYAIKKIPNTFNYAFIAAEEQGFLISRFSWLKYLNLVNAFIYSLAGLMAFYFSVTGFLGKLKNKKDYRPVILSSLLLAGNLMVLWYINYSWTISPGRYLYPTILPLFVLIGFAIKRLNCKAGLIIEALLLSTVLLDDLYYLYALAKAQGFI